ncbi:lipopolysaccharide biosynthesis protein [Rhodobacteraceae bacterium B1Z28]|uniref:Lipopolysaccharide biosynthesis protein n=1 Tax=Ruegeria haliotis TaxID=2747601 RepID=A0ABX2PUV7_9RHOB|nr:lipopolysaccharide biosynthesis protein [Ruegeria haliotis]NVO57337.1 lipopolysaccharide biosynthesis protein [Ruegeria haliotis]
MAQRESHEAVETAAQDTYGGTVVRGSLYTGLSQCVAVGCQIGSVLILSRLLMPADFGLIAMIGPIIAFLSLFKEMGLLQAVIQKQTLTYGQLNALFWINLGVSLTLTVLLIALAPLAAAFYNQPDLTWLIRVMALNMVITALGAQHFALLNRRMIFGRIAITASVASLCTLSTSIFFALVSPTPWALVAGTLVGGTVGAMLVWIWVPWRPSRPALAPGTAELLGFGAGVTGFKLANFLSRNLDNILIGRVWGGAALGFYDRAYKLILFPLDRVAQPLSQVMVPVLSRMQDEPYRYAHAFFRVFGLMQLAVLPGVAAMTGMADTAVPFLLGAQWADSAPIFAALGIAALAQPLANPTGWLFVSQGRTTEMGWWGLTAAVVTCGAFVWGVQYGVQELAMAYAGVTMLKLFPLWLLVSRKGPIGRDSIRKRILPIFCAGLAAYVIVLTVQSSLPGRAVLKLLCGVAISYAVFAGVLTLSQYGREILVELKTLIFKAPQEIRKHRAKRPA